MIKKIFWNGIKAILPIGITLALVIWVLGMIESAFGWVIKKIIGPQYYFDGLGLIVGLVLVFVVGLLMNAWIARKVYSWGEALLRRIPLVKTLYNAIADLMRFFDKVAETQGSYPVMVNLPDCRVLGILTRQSVEKLGKSAEGEVAVYIPMSYQIGGFTLMVPRSMVERLDMTVEKAMSFAITAGMSSES